ncbi:hypothetical protein N9D31_02580 [Oligoflexaceae bacterium]|nr:hypothetical protein [Oligoflexaceae bacterium]
MKHCRAIQVVLCILVFGSCSQTEKNSDTQKGHEVGNGGDVIICEKEYRGMNFKKARLFDFYESRVRHGLQSNLVVKKGDSVENIVNIMIERLAKLDPKRADLYASYYETFWDEAVFLRNPYFPTFWDDGPLGLPGGDCRIEQAAYQHEPMVDTDHRYFISERIWNLIDNEEKAGLIMHELIYRETIGLGEKNSRTARYFNGLTVSKRLISMDESQYRTLVRDTLRMKDLWKD